MIKRMIDADVLIKWLDENAHELKGIDIMPRMKYREFVFIDELTAKINELATPEPEPQKLCEDVFDNGFCV